MTYFEIVDEISQNTGLPRKEVEHRVWMEAVELGWNVLNDARRFEVTPHVFDSKMEQLYRDGDGFIFETAVFWARPSRQGWTRNALERLTLHAQALGRSPGELRILMLGDGSGNDSIFLAERGFKVDYFDFPGSKTFDYAMKRFERRGLIPGRVAVITDYAAIEREAYDCVLSFEVLEHLPDPQRAVADMAGFLKRGGIALVTEAFAAVEPELPTHLRSNLRFAGRLPVMCWSEGLLMTWASATPRFKPIEFRKVEQRRLDDFGRVITRKPVIAGWAGAQLVRLKDAGRRILGS